ncbi:MAG: class I SAM-dependent methyltransferase [Thermoleophilia bacterium]|nr:class I SAM-dependent methyltransferase [Thermoleophilia bacterium]
MDSADLWSERAAAYAVSGPHASGPDLDRIVAWAAGARTALDVATGGGHVARRLREAGLQVVTCDAAAGMQPDVICPAELLPFADRSFDVVTCRFALHHFTDVRAAVREMARVAADRVAVADMLHMGDAVEEAEKVRDPSHVRTYSAEELREIVAEAGLGPAEVVFCQRELDLDDWLSRVGCAGDDARRVTELLGDRVRDGRFTMDGVVLLARVGF